MAASLAPARVSEAYAVSGFVFYFTYLITVLVVVGAHGRPVVTEARRALPLLLGWGGLGWAVSWTYQAFTY